MIWRLGGVAATVALLVACGSVNQDNWNEKSADASCKYSKRCETANFYFNFENVGACVDNTVTMLDELDAYYTDCLYDNDAAKECLKALDSSCKTTGQEFNELRTPCFQVWDCADDFTPGSQDTPTE